ncbi:MAG TPA: aminodeoxychorismate synthase component I [Burkholderiaceae bacterium]|nr:aminodeoxychorismate synthase component I [Burkholderiaceae bacterium]
MTDIEVKISRVECTEDPQTVFARVRGDGAHHVLLESALPMERQAQWSYLAGTPVALLYTDANGTHLERDGRVERTWPNPFDALAAVCPSGPVRVVADGNIPAGLDFIGGWMGALSYDAARELHRLDERARHDPPLPTMWWMALDHVLAFHHPSRSWWQCAARGPHDAWPWTTHHRDATWQATLNRARGATPSRASWRAGERTQRMTQGDFEAGVARIGERIARGDMLQVNLSRREDAPFEGDAWSMYQDLTAAHPAPFAAFIETPGFAIASCSPERFIRLHNGRVQARPIKGTAPRGRDATDDHARREWLAASEKNRAENVMIVDLLRNDMSRVARLGSVRVPELFALEPYASVWQMVSTVEADLREQCGPVDLIRACWPPGSMTGAPKLAAMQAIEEIEPVRRGFYAGSIGYIDCRGGLDLSVVIRTAIVAQGRVMVQVGSGIVADSDPNSEWNETVAKGARLLDVLDAHPMNHRA